MTNRKNIIKQEAVVWALVMALTLSPLSVAAEANYYAGGGTFGDGAFHSIAIGTDDYGNTTVASKGYSIAVGASAQAAGAYSLAFGNEAKATESGGVAFGSFAKASVAEGVALGYASVSDRLTTATGIYVPTGASSAAVAATVMGNRGIAAIGGMMGTRQLVGVAAGIQDSDAVNVAQLKALDGVAVKYEGTDKKAVTLGNSTTPVKLKNVAEASLTSTSTEAVSGKQLYATNENVKTVSGNLETLDDVVAVNTQKITSNDARIAANSDRITALDGVAVKYEGTDKKAVTLGDSTTPVKLKNVAEASLTSTSTEAVTGKQLFATNQNISAVSGDLNQKINNISVETGFAVKYDDDTKNAVTLGGSGTAPPVKLKNVADADLSNTSTEAVTGKQLFATNQNISAVSGDLNQKINNISVETGFAVKYDDDTKNAVTLGGSGTAPPVKLKNVADADLSESSREAVTGKQLFATNQNISAVSGDLNQKINNISVETGLAVKYESEEKTAVTFGDSSKATVKLKNVADADLSEKSTEAVTGRQLFATNQNISAVSGDLNQKINNISVETGFAVKYDDDKKTSVTFGDVKAPVKLKNVAAGTSATEAVNYGQLSELDAKVNTLGGTVAERMGGAYDQNTGKITITYPSGPTPPTNSAAASSGPAANAAIPGADPTLNETLQKMWGSIQANSVTAGDNISVEGSKVSVVKNPEFESVRVGAVDITREGIDMGGKKITGLADGGIYNGSRDAVNGGQLWNAYNRIEELDNDIRVAGAHAAALSAMHPIAYNPYEPTTISAGYGYYRSEQSFAVGVFHYIRENVLVNAGMAFNSGGDTMGRAGVSFALGKSGRKQPSMIKDVNEMQKQMAAMQEMLMQLKEENEKNKEENRKNREIIKELKEALKEK